MKQQVRWVSLLLGGLVLFSHQRGVAQADDPPAVPEPAASVAATNAPSADEATAPTDQETTKRRAGRHRNAVVEFGRTAELKPGETAEAVVAILGSAIVGGHVTDAAVAVAGDVSVTGDVRDAVVAVLGNVKIEPGGTVKGDVVAVGGTITIAEGANVKGDIVSVGGRVDIAEGATTEGKVQEVPIPGLGLLKDWLVHCVLKLRPLAPQVGWVWVVAGLFFVLYFLVALAFPRPVQACLDEVTRRPATTLLVGLISKLLVPIVILILIATGIGVFVVPFLVAAVIFAGIIGKVAWLQYLGQQIGRQFGASSLQKPMIAFLLGSLIIALLYLVPILGMVVYGVTGVWALGAAVMAMLGGTRREMRQRPPSPPAPLMPGTIPPAGAAAFAATAPAATNPEDGTAYTGTVASGPAPAPMAVPPNPAVVAAEALALPRASFWERMGAGFLDVILVSILSALVGGLPLGLLVALAYFAGMWTWRGTTVGGIVLNLKVVRYDGQPMSFAVALIRALAAGFSAIVLFLGFLWIAWSRDKQAWHDKIAGTVVVRQARETPLLCL